MAEEIISLGNLSGVVSLIGLLITIATVAFKFGQMNERLTQVWEAYITGLLGRGANEGIGRRRSEIKITEKGERLLSNTMKETITKMVKNRKSASRLRFFLKSPQNHRIAEEYGYVIINEMMPDIKKRAHKLDTDIELLFSAILLYAEKVERIEEGKQTLLSGDSSKIESFLKEMPDSDKQQYLDELELKLKDPSPQVRSNAVVALGAIDGAEVIELLIPVLAERVDYVRNNAEFALERIGADAVKPLIAALSLKEKTPTLVRSSAARLLGRIVMHLHLDPVEKLHIGADELSKIEKDVFKALDDASKNDSNRYVRNNAEEALNSIKTLS